MHWNRRQRKRVKIAKITEKIVKITKEKLPSHRTHSNYFLKFSNFLVTFAFKILYVASKHDLSQVIKCGPLIG